MPRARPLCALALLAACHTSVRYTDTRTGETRTERRGAPRALPPAVIVTDRGTLRFVEPLACAVDSITDLATFEVERTRPNAATLVVGLIVTAAGVIAGANGLASDDPGATPFTYLGLAGVLAGAPLAIGPLVGNSTARHPAGVQAVRRPAAEERCGEQPMAVSHATIRWSGLRVEGDVAADGTFARSPFELVDAFAVGELPALALAIDLAHGGGTLRLDAVVDAGDLARARDGFFASRGLDGTVISIAQMQKVPQLEAGHLGVALAPGPAIRVSLPVDNVGPGDAYGVRMILTSSSPEVDGRIVYLGRVPARAHAVFDATFPLSRDGAAEISGGAVTFAAFVRDAHDTAPTTPVRFRGAVLRTGP